jgi:hypothetical protein
MCIGRSCGIDIFRRSIAHHVKETLVQEWFSLKIKTQVKKLLVHGVNGLPEEIHLDGAGWPCKGFEAAGALRTTKIAGSGGLNRNGKWQSRHERFADDLTQLIGAQHFESVPTLTKGAFGQKVKNIVFVMPGHDCKNK